MQSKQESGYCLVDDTQSTRHYLVHDLIKGYRLSVIPSCLKFFRNEKEIPSFKKDNHKWSKLDPVALTIG
jgi:hypothetical protein